MPTFVDEESPRQFLPGTSRGSALRSISRVIIGKPSTNDLPRTDPTPGGGTPEVTKKLEEPQPGLAANGKPSLSPDNLDENGGGNQTLKWRTAHCLVGIAPGILTIAASELLPAFGALSRRYSEVRRIERSHILDEFVAVTGYVLRDGCVPAPGQGRRRQLGQIVRFGHGGLHHCWRNDGASNLVARPIAPNPSASDHRTSLRSLPRA